MGKCGTCKYWRCWAEHWPYKDHDIGDCEHPKMYGLAGIDKCIGEDGMLVGREFGCIHHEEKQ